MDVRTGLIQVQRPVQYMNMLAEALFDGVHELLNDIQKRLRRRAIALLANLVDGLLGADADIGQKIVYGAVSLDVAGFLVASVLSGDESAIAALIFVVLMLDEGWILSGSVFHVGTQTMLTVPVEVEGCA